MPNPPQHPPSPSVVEVAGPDRLQLKTSRISNATGAPVDVLLYVNYQRHNTMRRTVTIANGASVDTNHVPAETLDQIEATAGLNLTYL